jgi:hypothetical protein
MVTLLCSQESALRVNVKLSLMSPPNDSAPLLLINGVSVPSDAVSACAETPPRTNAEANTTDFNFMNYLLGMEGNS